MNAFYSPEKESVREYFIFMRKQGYHYRPQTKFRAKVIFSTSVCQEFCSQGGCLVVAVLALGGTCPGGGVPAPGGTSSEGRCLLWGGAWSRRVPALGGCLVETPQWLLLRAVRILLECILDTSYFR